MAISIQAGDVNKDGSVTIELNGEKINFVKESDLANVKGVAKDVEKDRDSLRSQLATLNTKYDSEHQSHLQLRASYEELEKTAGNTTTLQEQLDAITKERDGLKEINTGYETKLTTRIKSTLSNGFKVSTEKLDGKSLTDLENMETVLVEAGHAPKPANYDVPGGPAGVPAGGKPFANPMVGATAAYESSNKSK